MSSRPKTFKHKHRAEYSALVNAIHRCHNPDHQAYYNYGARGIEVCEQWRDIRGEGFTAFLEHIGSRPTNKHTLDRIDNDGHYEPGNVRWATRTEQSNNRRIRCDSFTVNGETKTYNEWAEQYGLSAPALRRRVKAWPEEYWFIPPLTRGQRLYVVLRNKHGQ